MRGFVARDSIERESQTERERESEKESVLDIIQMLQLHVIDDC